MWSNYLKVAVRNTWKNRIYVAINVIGLGVAMAFCLTIYLLYAFNAEFDNYYKDTDNIYRIHELKQNTGRGLSRYDLAPMPLGPRLVQEIAGIEDQTRYFQWGENITYEDKIFYQSVGYADESFFDFFPIGLQSGSYSSFRNKSRVFIAEGMAKKYFGSSDPVGKTLTIHHSAGLSTELTVAGVFERIPFNSSFYFDVLIRIDNFFSSQQIKPDDWTIWQQPTTFLKLADNHNPEAITERLAGYIPEQNLARPEWKVSSFELVRFNDSSLLDPNITEGTNAMLHVAHNAVVIFAFLALLVLLIACFNLANTSMALIGNRVKEIGVRKVMGGASMQVFAQFMFEMSFTALLALLFGLAIYQWISSEFFALWNAPMEILDFSIFNLVISFAGLFILTTIIAGLYPALYSKRFQPVVIFRNQVRIRNAGITSKLMNAMQFSFSLVVLVGGIVFYRNANFLKSLNLGYRHENIINIYTNDRTEYTLMRDKINNHPHIAGHTATNDILAGEYEDTFLVLDTGNVEIRSRRVGDGYLDLMNVQLVAGRLFDRNLESDYGESVIVNQTYIERFGIKDPLGKLVNLSSGKRYIVGVASDVINNVHRGSVSIPEIYLPAREDESHILVVMTADNNRKEVFDFLAEAWKEIIPYRPFPGFFQENMALGGALNTANNMKKIFFYLAVLSGLLSLTGIFALSSLAVESRKKEIGIRKVMGATVRSIFMRLNREFMLVMSVSVLSGSMLAYFLINMLLTQIYKYHTSVGITTLVISGVTIAFVGLLTTSATIFKAATANPAGILRTE
ncbi:MAG TPA: ABC transporter permease [Cyclobacteriaceae bacterium]|nr:ABC transporter permease [Cyclobacteriaceae bacterium]